MALTNAECDASLGCIVRRHLHLHTVTNHQSNETLAHFTRNVRQYLMARLKLDFEHCARKYCLDRTFDLYCLIVALLVLLLKTTTTAATAVA